MPATRTSRITSYDLPRLRDGLRPFNLHWFPRLRSTSDHAAQLRKLGNLYAPAVVLTGHQLAGRGRGSHSWWSGPGSITATFVFPADEQLAAYHVPLIAGLAVRNAAAQLTSDDGIQLKWPNDLLYGDRKLAGLLCERQHKADLIGLGINVNPRLSSAPKELRDRITSLQQIADRPLDMTDALCKIARELHLMLSRRDETSFTAVLSEYDRHHALIGRRVTVTGGIDEPPVTGKCEGLDSIGRLLLRDRGKLHHVIAGQVTMR